MGLMKSSRNGVDIRAISEEMQPVVAEWYNAEIEIIDPHIGEGTFDRAENKRTGREPETLWTGPARIQAMRWPNVATARQEAIAARTVVFHIPMSEEVDASLIQEGFRVNVTDGGMSPEFVGAIYVITSSIASSYAWDRRIETMMDQGAVIS